MYFGIFDWNSLKWFNHQRFFLSLSLQMFPRNTNLKDKRKQIKQWKEDHAPVPPTLRREFYVIYFSLSLYKIKLFQVEIQVIIDETVSLKSTNNIFQAIKISFIEWNITRIHVCNSFNSIKNRYHQKIYFLVCLLCCWVCLFLSFQPVKPVYFWKIKTTKRTHTHTLSLQFGLQAKSWTIKCKRHSLTA